MGAVYFYHLTRRPMEDTLPVLLEKSLAAGWRVAVRGTDADRLARLDERLWLTGDGSFLPHGLAGGPHDTLQPVLLTPHRAAANAPHCVMAVDGAEIVPDELAGLERACILFDGNDDTAVQAARGQWSVLTKAGGEAQYWSEESGRWERKA